MSDVSHTFKLGTRQYRRYMCAKRALLDATYFVVYQEQFLLGLQKHVESGRLTKESISGDEATLEQYIKACEYHARVLQMVCSGDEAVEVPNGQWTVGITTNGGVAVPCAEDGIVCG